MYIITFNSFAEAQSATPPSSRRGMKRKLISQSARNILNQWYRNNHRYPYLIDPENVENLARECGLTAKQVKKWLSNKRARSKNTLKSNGGIHPTKHRKMKNEEEIRNNPGAVMRIKKRRAMLPPRAVEILKNLYVLCSRPTETEKRKLAKLANITEEQVSTWFSNTRNRRRQTKPRKKASRAGIPSNSEVDEVGNRVSQMSIHKDACSDTDNGTITYSLDETALCEK